MIALDGHLDLRELTAAVLLERQLVPAPQPASATRARYRKLEQVGGSAAILFAALAVSLLGPGEARFAAALRAAELALPGGPPPAPNWVMLRAALAQLRGLFPLQRPRLLKGCRAALGADAGDSSQAGTLLALLAAALDCPAVPGLESGTEPS